MAARRSACSTLMASTSPGGYHAGARDAHPPFGSWPAFVPHLCATGPRLEARRTRGPDDARETELQRRVLTGVSKQFGGDQDQVRLFTQSTKAFKIVRLVRIWQGHPSTWTPVQRVGANAGGCGAALLVRVRGGCTAAPLAAAPS